MDFSTAFLFLALAMIGVSYGWGMRGTIIGGEKGAMLPGAIMGMVIALFSASEVLRENFFVLSAVGAMGMYLGGCMTYGETLGLSMNTNPPENYKKGIFALVIKGFIWYALFGAFMGMALNAFAGLLYTVKDFIMIFCLLPFCAIAGYLLLNRPLDPEKGKFPLIYFSKTRQESWGGLLGILILLCAFAFKNKDSFTLNLILGAGLSGGIGWAIAQMLQSAARLTNKKGKRLFEKMNQRRIIDAWKLMEYFLGAAGGAGIALTLIFHFDKLKIIAAAIDAKGAINFPLQEYSSTFLIIWLVLIAIDQLQFIIKPRFSTLQLQNPHYRASLSESEYKRCLAKAEKREASVHYKRYIFLLETSEFALYSLVPMFFVLTSSPLIARLVSFFIIYLVVVQETVFDKYRIIKHGKLISTCLLLTAILILLYELMLDKSFSMLTTMIMYTFFYEMLCLIYTIPQANFFLKSEGKNFFNGPESTVHAYMVFSGAMSIILLCLAV